MEIVKTIVVFLSILVAVNVSCVPYGMSESISHEPDAPITIHPPEMMGTSEEKLPVEEVKESGFSKWVWIGLGVLVVGTAAAMASGGGGGDGGDDGSSPSAASSEGDVQVTW